MNKKIIDAKGIGPNNAAIGRKPRRKQAAPFSASAESKPHPPSHAPQPISDAAMILARQVAHLGLAALEGGTMPRAHALRGLMAAMITVASASMDRPNVVSWFRTLADELDEEARAEYGAQVRAAMRRQ